MLFSNMPADPSVLAALVKALEADPDNTALRLHLAGLLIEGGAESSAMDHILQVLNADPTNVPAIALAVKAADALGDSSRAAAYRKLLGSLQSQSEQAPAPRPPAPPPPPRAAPLPPAVDPNDPADPNEPQREPVSAEPDDRGWWEVEVSGVTLADVGGMEEVKRRLHVALIGPIRNPELREAYRKSLRGGLMLYGPPGCGKTFIARATAGELGARFLGIGLSDVLDMWFGNSERRLHEIFQHARRSAPCVVFFDELDAIGQKRANLQGAGAMRNVVNQLLAEMDGIGPDNEGVFLLGATNHPWHVDTALMRPGRFDRMALVLPPDEPARVAILEHHLKEKPASGVDRKAIAARTDGFSGADLAHLCEAANER